MHNIINRLVTYSDDVLLVIVTSNLSSPIELYDNILNFPIKKYNVFGKKQQLGCTDPLSIRLGKLRSSPHYSFFCTCVFCLCLSIFLSYFLLLINCVLTFNEI